MGRTAAARAVDGLHTISDPMNSSSRSRSQGLASAGLLPLLLCLVALAAPRLLAVDVPKGLDGTWKPSQAELGGKPMPPAIVQGITLKINGTNYLVTVRLPDGKESPDKGTLVIDPKAAPKTMTIRGVEGPNAGKSIPAIYELKEDTLRICYDLSGTATPKEFKSSPGTRLYLVQYARRKPAGQ